MYVIGMGFFVLLIIFYMMNKKKGPVVAKPVKVTPVATAFRSRRR